MENRRFNELNQAEAEELEKKRNEKLLWLDPYNTFSNSLLADLAKLGKVEYFDLLIKAIICGEVRKKDMLSISVYRKGSRTATHIERNAYWMRKNENIGYGSVGKKQKALLRTTATRINSYKQKLLDYEATLKL